MAGSPAYLDLLADIGARPPFPVTWDDLSDAWYRVTQRPDRIELHYLASVAFNLIAVETQTTKLLVLSDASQLHLAKNAGYAGADNPDPWANFRLATSFGVSPFDGVLVRLSDKWSRIQSLRRNPSNDRIGESLLDTLRDLAAYALIAICIQQEESVAA
jgi:hypothetical protein